MVRASETVEGRGGSTGPAVPGDRAADALRTATLQRLLPRLGLGPQRRPARRRRGRRRPRTGRDPAAVQHTLFGPAPATDADLVNLAHALDDIERQVAQS